MDKRLYFHCYRIACLVPEVGPGDCAAVPVPDLATLGAAEHVVGLLRVELDLVDRLLVPLHENIHFRVRNLVR